MLEVPTPASVTEVRRILGKFSWYRPFVPNFSSVVAPLSALLKKSRKFVWGEDCEKAFREIKEHLVAGPVLRCPDYNLPFIVQADLFGLV